MENELEPSMLAKFYTTRTEYDELLKILSFAIQIDYAQFSILIGTDLDTDTERFVEVQSIRIRTFRSLIAGCPDPEWANALSDDIDSVTVVDNVVKGLLT